MRPCDWCHELTDEVNLLGIERTPEHLCRGCYYCWKHGAPLLERDHREPLEDKSIVRKLEEIRTLAKQIRNGE